MRNRRFFKNSSVFTDPNLQGIGTQALVGNMSTPVAPDITAEIQYQPRPKPSRSASAQVGRYGYVQRRRYEIFKRCLDVAASVCALAVFGAILPLIALAIKLDSRGPVFYTQDRIGINRRRSRDPQFEGRDKRKVLQPGRPFRIIKLRTMYTDAEINGPKWAKKGDRRVTRVGRVLRKTRLDEVPQFVNVLRGQMSLIGPRPERLCFIRQLEKEVPHYLDRLEVLPGITGLAQVLQGYDTGPDSVRRKVALDRAYIQRSGVGIDTRIMLSTIKVVITGEGAY
jgi:lipopolysaccharide/colanic/teichoic acid biosynthesis glycosyltransferase